jgi:hypothetical protein
MSESELERELHRRGQELMRNSCKDTSILVFEQPVGG